MSDKKQILMLVGGFFLGMLIGGVLIAMGIL
jgi:hypothetical protein